MTNRNINAALQAVATRSASDSRLAGDAAWKKISKPRMRYVLKAFGRVNVPSFAIVFEMSFGEWLAYAGINLPRPLGIKMARGSAITSKITYRFLGFWCKF